MANELSVEMVQKIYL